jgi:hypothetical protein
VVLDDYEPENGGNNVGHESHGVGQILIDSLGIKKRIMPTKECFDGDSASSEST